MIKSKLGRRLGGLFIFILGIFFTAWIWRIALNKGYFYSFTAMVFPAFSVGGLGMFLFPFDEAQLKRKYGVDKLKLSHYPTIWKVIFVIAIIAGVMNYSQMK